MQSANHQYNKKLKTKRKKEKRKKNFDANINAVSIGRK